MAIFSNKQPPKNGDQTAAGETAGAEGISIIAHGMRVIGDLEAPGIIRVEGTVEGAVRSGRQVLIGRLGVVKGDVHARDVVVGGRIEGNLVGVERVEIQGTSLVAGDIETRTIVVLEGGRINGAVRMLEGSPDGAKADSPA